MKKKKVIIKRVPTIIFILTLAMMSGAAQSAQAAEKPGQLPKIIKWRGTISLKRWNRRRALGPICSDGLGAQRTGFNLGKMVAGN